MRVTARFAVAFTFAAFLFTGVVLADGCTAAACSEASEVCE